MLAHLPSGRFAPNSAWAICAAITHNLLRAAGTLTNPHTRWPRGATLRRHIITVPAGSPARNAAECCTCPRIGPGWSRIDAVDCRVRHRTTSHRVTHDRRRPRPDQKPKTVEKLADQQP
jgi:hypothetical protein